MTRKKFYIAGETSFRWLSFDSIVKSYIQNATKSLWCSFFGIIVNSFQLLTFFCEKKLHHKCSTVFQKGLCCKEKRIRLLFHTILYNFKNIVVCFFPISLLGKVLQCLFQRVFLSLVALYRWSSYTVTIIQHFT